MVANGAGKGDKGALDRVHHGHVCRAKPLSPGAVPNPQTGKPLCQPGSYMTYVKVVEYSERLDVCLVDEKLSDLGACLKEHSSGGAVNVDYAFHPKIMMTTCGAIIVPGEQEELSLTSRGALLKDLHCGLGKHKKWFVLLFGVLEEVSQATMEFLFPGWPPSVKVLMPKLVVRSDKSQFITRPKPGDTHYDAIFNVGGVEVPSQDAKEEELRQLPEMDAQHHCLVNEETAQEMEEQVAVPAEDPVYVIAWNEVELAKLGRQPDLLINEYREVDRSKGPSMHLHHPNPRADIVYAYHLKHEDEVAGARRVERERAEEGDLSGRKNGYAPQGPAADSAPGGVRRPRAKKPREAKVPGKASLEARGTAMGRTRSGGVCKVVQPTLQQHPTSAFQQSYSRLPAAPFVRGLALDTNTVQGPTAGLGVVPDAHELPGLLLSGHSPHRFQAMYNAGTGNGNGQVPDGMSHGSYPLTPQPSSHPDVFSLYQSQPCQGHILLSDHLDNEHPPGWGSSAPGVHMTPPHQPTMHLGTSSPSFGVASGLPLGNPIPPVQQYIPADGRLEQCSPGHLQHMRGNASNCFSLASLPEMPPLPDLDVFEREFLKELASTDSPDLLAMPGSCPVHSGRCPLPAHTSMAVPGMMPGYASSPDAAAGMDLAECLQLKAFIQEKGPGLDIPDFQLVDNAVAMDIGPHGGVNGLADGAWPRDVPPARLDIPDFQMAGHADPMDIVPPGGADSLAIWAPQPGSPCQPDLPRQRLQVDSMVPPNSPCLVLGAAPHNVSCHLGQETPLQDPLTFGSDQELGLPGRLDARDGLTHMAGEDCDLFPDEILRLWLLESPEHDQQPQGS